MQRWHDVSVNVSMASSSAKALSALHCGFDHCGSCCFNGLLIGQGTVGCRRQSLSTRLPRFNGLLIGQGTVGRLGSTSRGNRREEVSMASSSAKALSGLEKRLSEYKLTMVSMASSSAKALSVEPRSDVVGETRRGFNGLLIGQGTVGWERTGAGLGSYSVSMASSSAKALSGPVSDVRPYPEQGFNGLLIGQGTVGMTQNWYYAPSACFNGLLIGQGTVGRIIHQLTSLTIGFQWPPHRPRHCRSWLACIFLLEIQVSMASSSAKALSGLASREPPRMHQAFQWPPHRPRHCRAKSVSCRWLPVNVSMASSSAKALSAKSAIRGNARLCFNGLLIGQGTVGYGHFRHPARISCIVSMASSSAKALSVGTEYAEAVRRGIGFQWPPHRPRHCRSSSSPFNHRSRTFQWPPHRPRHCRVPLRRSRGAENPFVSMASSSAKALSAGRRLPKKSARLCFNGLLIGQGTVGLKLGAVIKMFMRFNGLLIGQGTVGRGNPCTGCPAQVSMASSSAKALSDAGSEPTEMV